MFPDSLNISVYFLSTQVEATATAELVKDYSARVHVEQQLREQAARDIQRLRQVICSNIKGIRKY